MAYTMKLFGRDECGDEVMVYKTLIPFQAGELTNLDLELIFNLKLERDAHIADMGEWNGFWYETDYRTKEDLEQEEQEEQDAVQRILEDNPDMDEDEAYDLYLQEVRNSRWGF